MGGASSTQRGGKATQSQTIILESTNANTPKNIAQVIQSRQIFLDPRSTFLIRLLTLLKTTKLL